MSIIKAIYYAVKSGSRLEEVIPPGSDARAWAGLIANYDPDAKPKRKPAKRTGSGRTTRRSQKAAMDSVVSRVNGGKVLNAWGRATAEIPFDGSGPEDDTEGTEAALGLQSPF